MRCPVLGCSRHCSTGSAPPAPRWRSPTARSAGSSGWRGWPGCATASPRRGGRSRVRRRRLGRCGNVELVLVGLELILLAAGIVLVTAGALGPDTTASGNVLTLFVITIAAAEVVLALAILVAAYRAQGHVDLERAGDA